MFGNKPVESQTRTHHGRVDSRRGPKGRNVDESIRQEDKRTSHPSDDKTSFLDASMQTDGGAQPGIDSRYIQPKPVVCLWLLTECLLEVSVTLYLIKELSNEIQYSLKFPFKERVKTKSEALSDLV